MIVGYGDRVRIEKHFQEDRWFAYELVPVEGELHPQHNDHTTEKEVWMKLGEGTEEEMRQLAEEVIRQMEK